MGASPHHIPGDEGERFAPAAGPHRKNSSLRNLVRRCTLTSRLAPCNMTRNFPGFFALMLFASVSIAGAEDFKMSDGTVYRQARVVEVRPDALILLHESGSAMADLAKLPKAIQNRYNYDPAKAAAHRERETAARKTIAEDANRLIEARNERRMALSRAQFEAIQSAPLPGENVGEVSLSYQASAGDRTYAAAIAHVAGEIARTDASRRAAASEPVTFWTLEFWQHPVLRVLTALMGGAGPSGGSAPRSDSEPRGWR